jgi:hypothetical protein
MAKPAPSISALHSFSHISMLGSRHSAQKRMPPNAKCARLSTESKNVDVDRHAESASQPRDKPSDFCMGKWPSGN